MLKRDLRAPASPPPTCLRATDCVMPCFEIVDSRIRDWKIKIQDTVADNASCGVFVLGGQRVDPRDVDLAPAAWCWRKTARSSAPAPARRRRARRSTPWPGWPTRWAGLGIAPQGRRNDPVGLASPLVPVKAGDSLHCSVGGIGSTRCVSSKTRKQRPIMKLDKTTIADLADHLENAELKAHDVTKITDDHPEMDWDDAYAVQDEIRRRKEARGQRIAGLKAGLTSNAKMKQMGVRRRSSASSAITWRGPTVARSRLAS